jgi:hypothetical protein
MNKHSAKPDVHRAQLANERCSSRAIFGLLAALASIDFARS